MLAVGLLGCALLGAGCGGNAGGKTTCGDFLQMSVQQRTKAVSAMLADHDQAADQSNVALSLMSAGAYCSLGAGPDSPIENIGGG